MGHCMSSLKDLFVTGSCLWPRFLVPAEEVESAMESTYFIIWDFKNLSPSLKLKVLSDTKSCIVQNTFNYSCTDFYRFLILNNKTFLCLSYESQISSCTFTETIKMSYSSNFKAWREKNKMYIHSYSDVLSFTQTGVLLFTKHLAFICTSSS